MKKIKEFFAKNEIAKLIAVLAAITSATALVLSVVNGITAPIIFEKEQAATFAAMRAFITDAEDFEQGDVDTDANPLIIDMFTAKTSGNTVGYAIKVAPSGYGGAIEMIVAFDASGAIIGSDVITHSETSNIGTKVLEASFTSQFVGQSSVPVSADTISGATVSSSAYILGIETAVSYLQANK